MSKQIITSLKLDKTAFILNPFSGYTLKEKQISRISGYIDRHVKNAEIIVSGRRGEVSEITKRKIREGIRKIVAIGGDGTVNEIAKVIVDAEIALGIIPTGSGNGLARHLRIPMRFEKAVNVINHCAIKKMDYGLINGKPFFCTTGIGFDAEVGHKFAKQNRRGFITYLKIILSGFRAYKPEKYTLIIDDQEIKREAFLLTLANASQWGNNACISPMASVEDGLLDICVLSPFPAYMAADIGVRLLTKKIERSRYLEIFRSDKILIKSSGKTPIHYDGEPGEITGNIEVKIIPQGLNIMVPDQTLSI